MEVRNRGQKRDSRTVVVNVDPQSHPQCQHGPTLLFRRTSKSGDVEEFYACSGCRDRKDCSFYLRKTERDVAPRNFKAEDNLSLHRSMHSVTKNDTVFYCHNCEMTVGDLKSHTNHNTVACAAEDLKWPTKILSPKDDDKKEAQYFFSDSTLDTFIRICKDLKLNKLICIGAPRLHERVSQTEGFQSILLDFDRRLLSFYSPDHLIWYNMFNHHFMCGEYSQNRFDSYLRESPNEKLCLVVDPPFGCRTEALVMTLKRIQVQYQLMNRSVLPIMWIFPYFMERYVLQEMPEMNMLDYKVNYTNHKTYQESGRFGSPIRIFTNIQENLIRLGDGYRFCVACRRDVCAENKHCDKCRRCSSKNGATYVHCNQCAVCVKPYYRHCDNCNRCAQKEHNCTEFQMNSSCWICWEQGHVEKYCPKVSNRKRKHGKGVRQCLICNKLNHNERNCKQKLNKIE